MTVTLHKNIPPADGHGILSNLGPYANATARRAATVTAADVSAGKVCRQTDTGEIYYLASQASGVPTWRQIPTTADGSAIASILGSEPSWWIDGVTSTIIDAGGGLASAASDASGHGVDAAFATGHRPSIIASGLNGKRTLRFTSSQYGGNSSFVSPAPGTTASYFFAVVKSTTATGGTLIINTGSNNIYWGAGPTVSDFNGGSGGSSSSLSAGTWGVLEILRSNQATDYVQIGGVTGTAGNAGNTANTGWSLNANSGGGIGSDDEFATVFQWLGTPSPTQRAQLRAWANSVWGV